jgi:tetratricopeptide (TPR) repeat protein
MFNDLELSKHPKDLLQILINCANEFLNIKMYLISEYLFRISINRITESSFSLFNLRQFCLSQLSACYWHMKNYSLCIHSLKLELELIFNNNKQLKDLKNEYRLYGNLACAYNRLNINGKCLINFDRQLSLAYEMKDAVLIETSLNSIGLVYCKMKDYENALHTFEKCLDVMKPEMGIKYEKQLSLVGECYMKVKKYDKAKELFDKQLKIKNVNEQQDTEQLLLRFICLSNLGACDFKLKNYKSSIEFYETCLENLISNRQSIKLKLMLYIELHGCVYLGLINNFFALDESSNASIYSKQLLAFTLSELICLDKEKREGNDFDAEMTYLKYLEMTACFKRAICFTKQKKFHDALRLHEREAFLAKQLKNTLFLARALSNMAQIYFLDGGKYEISIDLYRQILKAIDISPKNRRHVEIAYFAMSNMALCLEKLLKINESIRILEQQSKISDFLSLNFKCMCLLNLTQLIFKQLNISDPNERDADDGAGERDPHLNYAKLLHYLNDLFQIFQSKRDVKGQLFVCQFSAFVCQARSKFKEAIEFYLIIIELCKTSKKNIFIFLFLDIPHLLEQNYCPLRYFLVFSSRFSFLQSLWTSNLFFLIDSS